MERTSLSNTDVNYSRLIYGVWRLSDDTNTTVDHVRAKIDAALDQGITTFDHADIYGNYECEKLFGQALAADSSLRQKMEIITKCDICLNTDKFPLRRVKYYDTSAAYINASVEQSLKYLHTDVIDTLLIHRPDPMMNAAETGDALDALVSSGKVRSVGVSNFRSDDWRLLQKHMKNPLVTNQIEISILEQTPFVNGDLSALQLDDIAVLGWSPLSGGQLFDDGVNAKRVRPILERIAAEQLSPNNRSRIDLVALAWLLVHPAKISPVIGTNNLSRIKGLSGALDVKIDRETWYEIYIAATGNEVP